MVRRRRKKQPRFSRGRVSLFFFFSFLLIAYVFYTSLFRVEHVVVWHTVQTKPRSILAASALKPYQPFPLRRQRIVDRLKRKDWVRDVEITFRRPHTLLLSLKERQPKYTIKGHSEIALTDDGRLLRLYHRKKLPLLQLPEKFVKNKRVPRELPAVLTRLAQVDYAPYTLEEIHVLKGLSLLLYLKGKVLIKWGRMNPLEEKIAVLRMLLKKLSKRGGKLREINVQSPQNPAVRLY